MQAASPARRLTVGVIRLRTAADRLVRGERQRRRERGEALAAVAARLHALSPLATLSRGYAIVSRPPDLPVVYQAGQLAVGDAVRLRLGQGTAQARIEAIDSDGEPT